MFKMLLKYDMKASKRFAIPISIGILVAGLLGALGSTMKQEIVGGAAQKILPSWLQRSYGGGSRRGSEKGGEEKGSDSKNSNAPKTAAGQNTAKNAITGSGKSNSPTGEKKKNNDNTNNKKVENNKKGNGLVNNAINNTGKSSGGYDDLYDD
jgi:hypothetical protein